MIFPLVLFTSLACRGNKKVMQTPQNTIVPKTEAKVQNIKTPKPAIPIEEKAPEIAIEKKTKNSISKKKNAVAAVKTTPKVFDHQIWDKLLAKNVSKDGTVNYKGFQKERTKLKTYLKTLSANTPTKTWSKKERLAYWMNAYNAFTIKLIIDHYPIKSIKNIKGIKHPWDYRFFKLGSKWYTLNHLEHRILRKMRGPQNSFRDQLCLGFLSSAFK